MSIRTQLLKLDPLNPDPSKLELAAQALREGKLVAFPTETVYGLGANALDEKAVLKIFRAKSRPLDNPVIVHIAKLEDLELLAERIPDVAFKLASKFWPGPLTLIIPKSELVPDLVTAGLPSVGVRMPSHPISRELILRADLPVAAPSANLAGRPSPTNAQHVIQDLWGRLDLILDAGEVGYGLESTVLDLTEQIPTILRPGPISPEQLRPILGEIRIHPIADTDQISISKSPGMKYRHYSPQAQLILVEGKLNSMAKKIKEMYDEYSSSGIKVGILGTQETSRYYGGRLLKILGSRSDYRSIAKNLFRMLREYDQLGVDVILAEGVDPHGIGLAIMDRLRKASWRRIRA